MHNILIMPLSPPDSDALWIAAPWRGGARSSAAVPHLRKTFLLPGNVVSASLKITAFGLYEAEINGQTVGEDVFAPGWTDYHKRVQFQTHDVSGLLREGENVIGVTLGDGWYCGFIAWQDRQVYGEKPWLLAQLTAKLSDGSTVKISSDDSWKVSSGPVLESDLLMGEIHDARLELRGWSSPGYDDSQWLQTSQGNPHPQSEVIPPLSSPVQRIQEIEPLCTREFPDGQGKKGLVIDFGQNFSGRVRIRVRAAAGTTLRLRYAEVLDEAGNLYTDNLRSARATDFYTCRGDDGETWEPRFTFHGFRYMDIIGLSTEDSIETTGVVLHSVMEQTGTFACSNPLLNQLQSNILWGQKSNFLEVPTDCPQRDERLGWTGDAQVFVRTAAFNMDVRRFFNKWLLDLRDAQHPSGAVPLVAPMPGFLRHIPFEDGGPAWSDATIICPWTIYLCYGDKQVLRDHYASMKKYLDFLDQERSKEYIRSHPEVDTWGGFGDWLALDGSGKTEGNTPKDLIGTAFYALDAAIMADTASVLGRADEERTYRTLHQKIVAAFRKRFVTPDGLLAGGTQTSYVLALEFDLIPETARATCANELVRLIERNNWHLATGFIGTPHLLSALEKHGYLDIAYKLLEQESFPSWLFSVKNGATTIWERWNGWTPEGGMQDKSMNSFNHYAYGAVGAWMYQTVAGLNPDPAEPGYRHIVFQPKPGGTLTWAEATLETIFGQAGIRWSLEGGSFAVKVTVPEGSRATLIVPSPWSSEPLPLNPGTHSFSFHQNGKEAQRKSTPHTPKADTSPNEEGALAR